MFFRGIADAIVSLSLAGMVNTLDYGDLWMYTCDEISRYMEVTWNREQSCCPEDKVVVLDKGSQELKTWTGPYWNVTIESGYTGTGGCTDITWDYYPVDLPTTSGIHLDVGSNAGEYWVRDVCEIDGVFFYKIGDGSQYALTRVWVSTTSWNKLAAMLSSSNVETLHAVLVGAYEIICRQIRYWPYELPEEYWDYDLSNTTLGDVILDSLRTFHNDDIAAFSLDGAVLSPSPSPSWSNWSDPSPSPYPSPSPTTVDTGGSSNIVFVVLGTLSLMGIYVFVVWLFFYFNRRKQLAVTPSLDKQVPPMEIGHDLQTTNSGKVPPPPPPQK